MSLEYCMNWMFVLALIDFNAISIEAFGEEEYVNPTIDNYQPLNHRVVLEEFNIESAWDKFCSLGTTNSVKDMDLYGFPDLEVELMEEDDNAYELLCSEVDMDKYESISSGDFDDNLAWICETKNIHNVGRRAIKKERRAKKRNPTQIGVYNASTVHSHPTITT